MEIVILSGDSCSLIARGAVEGPAVRSWRRDLRRFRSDSAKFVFASLAYNFQGEQRMNIQQQPGFHIAGITIRTNNAIEMSGKGKIGSVWQEFLQPNLVAKIPNKIGVDLIAAYTDYETDHTGHYTYLLGIPVLSDESLPSSVTFKRVPAGRYAVFISGRGQLQQIVPEIWQRIWSMSPEELGGIRAFKTDYEIYDQRAANPDNAQIDVYVGLR